MPQRLPQANKIFTHPDFSGWVLLYHDFYKTTIKIFIAEK